MTDKTTSSNHKSRDIPGYRPAILLTGLYLFAGGMSLILTNTLIQNVLVPLIRNVFSNDGIIDPGTVDLLHAFIIKIGQWLILLSALTLAYDWISCRLLRLCPEAPKQNQLPSNKPVTYNEAFVILAILTLGAYLRMTPMERGLCYDEIHAWINHIKPGPVQSLFHSFKFNNHIGATFLAWVSTRLFGLSEWSLRLPSHLLGLSAIIFIWTWLRKTVGTKISLLSAFFLALSPAHAIWSSSARGYAACVLFTVVSTAIYQRCLSKPSTKFLLTFIVVNIIGLSFNVFFIFLLFTQMGYLAVSAFSSSPKSNAPPGATRTWKALGISLLFSILVYLPISLLALFKFTDGRVSHVSAFFPFDILKDMWNFSTPATIAALFLSLFGLWHFRNTSLRGAVRSSLVMGLLVVLVWLFPPKYLITRYWATLLPFLIIGLSAGILAVYEMLRKTSRPLAIAATGLLCVVLTVDMRSHISPALTEFNGYFREIAAATAPQASRTDRFCAVGDGATLFAYYADHPVEVISNWEAYQAFLQKETRAICFAMPTMPQTKEHEKIIRDVQGRSREIRIGDTAAYIVADVPAKRFGRP